MAGKLLIAILLVACVAPMIIKGPDGEPIMTLDDWKPDVPATVDELKQQVMATGKEVMPEKAASVYGTVYRWQDENGAWHFSDQAPPDSNAELIEISDANLVDALEVPQKQAPSSVESNTSPLSRMPGMTVSPKQLKETMENLEQLQGKIDERQKVIDAVE
ncbi:MAG: DUF4124 domain-containing protein [Pseudomonadota bacterium]